MNHNPLRLIVGDNPFHGISHLSQQRARERTPPQTPQTTQQAAHIVERSVENGANGFMFSVDETTLAIIQQLRKNHPTSKTNLYAIAPYAYAYVRKATQTGGVSGLAMNFARNMLFSSNAKVITTNLGGLAQFNPSALLKTYTAYELSRIKSAAGNDAHIESFMLHEIITDMALALNMESLFKEYITFLENRHIRPGFETRNFSILIDKFNHWNIDLSKLTLTSSFNKVGFQMCPSKRECEEALKRAGGAEIIAMSVLAAGYLKPIEAVDYLTNLEGVSGAVIGVSGEHQADETFRVFRECC
ncbi:MAG: hypothetical protein LBQ98_00680 [Nitrososphaerota archaeon]|jgi:hypothetical protein|nr:hypothetical protein [Nitrososphaerota archaeon]